MSKVHSLGAVRSSLRFARSAPSTTEYAFAPGSRRRNEMLPTLKPSFGAAVIFTGVASVLLSPSPCSGLAFARESVTWPLVLSMSGARVMLFCCMVRPAVSLSARLVSPTFLQASPSNRRAMFLT